MKNKDQLVLEEIYDDIMSTEEDEGYSVYLGSPEDIIFLDGDGSCDRIKHGMEAGKVYKSAFVGTAESALEKLGIPVHSGHKYYTFSEPNEITRPAIIVDFQRT